MKITDRHAKQEVNLLSITENPLKLLYTAAKTCYSSNNALEMFNQDVDENKMLLLVTKVLGMGHESIMEHCFMTFAVSGISRALSHQHVRHRLKTFSQKSQRYVAYHEPFSFIVPKSIEPSKRYRGGGLNMSYNDLMEMIQGMYSSMLADGIPAEDARYILPNACETSYVVSCNLRELAYFAGLRRCSKAQWEIRMLADKMCVEVVKKHTWLERYLVPKCVKYKQCTELTPCGLMDIIINKLEEKEIFNTNN